jgi:hypothetical protein
VYKSVESIGTTDRLSTQTGARAKLLHASPAFCPRRHTGFGVTQVGASIGKTGLVHSKGAALLLLLFIDIPIKEQPELPETVPTHPTKVPQQTWRGPHRAKLHWRPTHAKASPIAGGNQPGEDVKGSSWAGPHHAAEIPKYLKHYQIDSYQRLSIKRRGHF